MTQKTTMTVTRALAEKKALDQKISTFPYNTKFIGVKVGRQAFAKEQSGLAVTEAENAYRSSMQTLEALIAKRARIKSALVVSNANTKVKTTMGEITVAEAIELKASISVRRVVVEQLKRNQLEATTKVEQLNSALRTRIDKLLGDALGKEAGKADEATTGAITNPQLDLHEASLIDPSKLSAVIQKMEDEIANIDTELDYTLSEINAKTEISIEV